MVKQRTVTKLAGAVEELEPKIKISSVSLNGKKVPVILKKEEPHFEVTPEGKVAYKIPLHYEPTRESKVVLAKAKREKLAKQYLKPVTVTPPPTPTTVTEVKPPTPSYMITAPKLPRVSPVVKSLLERAYKKVTSFRPSVPKPTIVTVPTPTPAPVPVVVSRPVQPQVEEVYERPITRRRVREIYEPRERVIEKPPEEIVYPPSSYVFSPSFEYSRDDQDTRKLRRRFRLRYAPKTLEDESYTYSPSEITNTIYAPYRYQFVRSRFAPFTFEQYANRYAPETFTEEDISPYTYNFIKRMFEPFTEQTYAPQYYSTSYQTYQPVNVDKYKQKTAYEIADNSDVSPPYILQNVYDPRITFNGNKFAPEINDSTEVDISPKTTMVFNVRRPKPSQTNVYLNVLNNLLKKREVKIYE